MHWQYVSYKNRDATNKNNRAQKITTFPTSNSIFYGVSIYSR